MKEEIEKMSDENLITCLCVCSHRKGIYWGLSIGDNKEEKKYNKLVENPPENSVFSLEQIYFNEVIRRIKKNNLK